MYLLRFNSSHSLSGEPRTYIVSRLETQQGTVATHILENQEQTLLAGLKHSKAQQGTARHSHSLSGEPRTDIVSRLEA